MALRNESGWTLMETLVVTSMITIIAAAAVPQYAALAQQMRAGAVATQVLDDVNYARMMAMRTGRAHYVKVDTGAQGVHYKVQRAAAPPAIAPGSDPVLRDVNLAARLPGVVFNLNGATTDPYGGTIGAAAPNDALVFDPRGLPTISAAFVVASADGGAAYAVSVTGAGHTRVWKQTGQGWK